MPATKPVLSFVDYLARELGTRYWVVAGRLTSHLKEKGYTIALSVPRYNELHRAWEVEVYGAPLQSIQDAAPEMLEALRKILTDRDGPDWVRQVARAAIAKAEGRAE